MVLEASCENWKQNQIKSWSILVKFGNVELFALKQ